MLWVVQTNLYNETGYVRFLEALVRLDIEHVIVKPVPFTSIILPADFDSMTQDVETTPEPVIDTDQKVMVMGATTLTYRIRRVSQTQLNLNNFHPDLWRYLTTELKIKRVNRE